MGISFPIHMMLASSSYPILSASQDVGPHWSFSTGGRALEDTTIGMLLHRILVTGPTLPIDMKMDQGISCLEPPAQWVR